MHPGRGAHTCRRFHYLLTFGESTGNLGIGRADQTKGDGRRRLRSACIDHLDGGNTSGRGDGGTGQLEDISRGLDDTLLHVIPCLTVDGGLVRTTVTGYVTTLLTTDEVGDTAVTTPLTSVSASADSVTVAGWPTAIFEASDSAKLATTSRLSSPWMVMKLDEELDDEDPLLDEPPEDALPLLVLPPLDDDPPLLPSAVDPDVPDEVPVDDELELDPVDTFVDEPPSRLTVSPTEPPTAVAVPLISAVSVVPARAFWSAVAGIWSSGDIRLVLGDGGGRGRLKVGLGRLHGELLGLSRRLVLGHCLLVRRDVVLIGHTRTLGGGKRCADAGCRARRVRAGCSWKRC